MKNTNLFKYSNKKILFLGYDTTETKLINFIKNYNIKVTQTNQKLNKSVKSYDIIICFGYRHIIKKNFIDKCNCPIINLHISYLPYNRGAHPNFWSFFDGTVSGVTIHLVDAGIDTGPILFQKKIIFKNENTFFETYKKLFNEVENLFIKNFKKIIENNFKPKQQSKLGTFHLYSDLPENFKGWNSNIKKEIKRLKKFNN